MQDVTIASTAPLDLAIVAWLDNAVKRTGSMRTYTEYARYIADFRRALQAGGLDLDRQNEPQGSTAITLVLQSWAGRARNDPDRTVGPATFNLRVAAISSFYRYALRQRLLIGENPADRVDRSVVQRYRGAIPIPELALQQALAAIDVSTISGVRDRALLLVALSTGRRLTELGALDLGDLQFVGDRCTVTFRRCKGNKQMADTLDRRISAILLGYIVAEHGEAWATLAKTTPVWLGHGYNNPGGRLGRQGIASTCERWLGTRRVHTLRHTFASLMLRAGADMASLQGRLGHNDLGTTGHYVRSLKGNDNPFAASLGDLLGV